MNCKTCEYNFALLDIDYDGEKIQCKYEICVYTIREKKRKQYKCCGCAWGTWTGLCYKCALPRCMPKLGDFNGVGKNDKQKNL